MMGINILCRNVNSAKDVIMKRRGRSQTPIKRAQQSTDSGMTIRKGTVSVGSAGGKGYVALLRWLIDGAYCSNGELHEL